VAELDEFLQQVLADQREWEADPTPQTPAYALLAAGRLEEAEAVARKAVSDLEKENAPLTTNIPGLQSENVTPLIERAALDEQNSLTKNNTQLNLLADALIAHGIALARLKKLEAAQTSLERAIAVAQEAGAPEKGGLASLTMIEELDQLSRETLLTFYEQAGEGLAKIRNRKLQWRLIDAAKKVMARFWGEMDSDRALEILLARPPGLHEQMTRHEATLIKQVLTHTDASISETASLAHSDSGRVTCIIELRYKALFKKRTTDRRRSTKE
jgi:tetratricopeptide (TPR) repeat protein